MVPLNDLSVIIQALWLIFIKISTNSKLFQITTILYIIAILHSMKQAVYFQLNANASHDYIYDRRQNVYIL